MNCPNCNTPGKGKFCTKCGAELIPVVVPAKPTDETQEIKLDAAQIPVPQPSKTQTPTPQPKVTPQPVQTNRSNIPLEQVLRSASGKLRASGILALIAAIISTGIFALLLIGFINSLSALTYRFLMPEDVQISFLAIAIGTGIGALWTLVTIIVDGVHAIRALAGANTGSSDPSFWQNKVRTSHAGGYMAVNIIFTNVLGIVSAALNIGANSTYRNNA